jgi:hypothetical protein
MSGASSCVNGVKFVWAVCIIVLMYGFSVLFIMIPALMFMSIEYVVSGYNIGVYVWNVSNIGCVRSAIVYRNVVFVWFGFWFLLL